MKKISILILVCLSQSVFSQTIMMNSASNYPEPTGIKIIAQGENDVYDLQDMDVKPEFPGGTEGFNRFIKDTYKIPDEQGLKGKIYMMFTIEKDGSLNDFRVMRDIGYGTGIEAIRVLKISPKWIPGQKNNKPVRVRYSIPISIVK